MEKADNGQTATDHVVGIMQSMVTDAEMVIDAIRAGDEQLALDLLRMMQGGRAVGCAIDWLCVE